LTATQPATDEVAGGHVAFTIFAVAWIVVLVLYCSHAIVLSSDSINNHVHVWYIAHDLWHHGRLPWRMPVLAHGDAYAYPYGFVNWTTAALLWPLFGNWTVTLWTALGTVGCIIGTFVAFPELGRGWYAAAALANPAIIEALLFGQQSFAWAAAMLLFGIAAWRRGHRLGAALLVGVAQATHAAIVLPIALILVLVYLPFTREKWALVRWYALSCVIALPAVGLVLATPTNGDISASEHVADFLITLGPRILIVALPLGYVLMRRTGIVRLAPCALAVSLLFSAAFEIPLNVGAQWHALWHRAGHTADLDAYLHSPEFRPGATYRVLRARDGKLGLYHVLRAGGHLDSEMFPESMAIKNFRNVDEYAALLCDRRVDQVLHDSSYDDVRHTNEAAFLQQLAQGASNRVRVDVAASGPGWQAYAVDRSHC